MTDSQSLKSFSQKRRLLLAGAGGGLLSAALGYLSNRSPARKESSHRFVENGLHHPAKVKNVIFLFMPGGPSQLDLFDPKPEIKKYDGKLAPDEIRNDPKFFTINETSRFWPTSRKFQACGKSGIEISELLPKHREIADELCLIRSMITDSVNHDPAQSLLMSGTPLLGRPSMGSWVSYGLGSECENLPAFVVLSSGQGAAAGANNWSSGFLPQKFSGVPFRSKGDPILYLANPPGIDEHLQRKSIDTINQLNQLQHQSTLDPDTESRIASYELAFKMQQAAPALTDFSDETPATLANYGLSQRHTTPFGRNCLMARRLVEQGTRFVMLVHGSWDDHKNLNQKITSTTSQIDQPIATLIKDLKQRGLLEETLIIWGGEFGRTPTSELYYTGRPETVGRDHHGHGFSIWLTGGGIKRGITYGETDELGLRAARDTVHMHDLQATIMHLLGIDHKRLTYPHQGRDFRLTDVGGSVVQDILS